MFGEEFLNGKALAIKLGISQSKLYSLRKLGLPFHQLGGNTRKYYVFDEVQEWLKTAGFQQQTTWTKCA